MQAIVLVRAEAERVFVAARESHNEGTRNTLQHFTHVVETLKGSIFGVKSTIPVLIGPGGGFMKALGEKASLLDSQFDSKYIVS